MTYNLRSNASRRVLRPRDGLKPPARYAPDVAVRTSPRNWVKKNHAFTRWTAKVLQAFVDSQKLAPGAPPEVLEASQKALDRYAELVSRVKVAPRPAPAGRTNQPFGLENRERKRIADELFRNNRFSDEYYTPKKAWEPFMDRQTAFWLPHKHTAVWEPFAGDGQCYKNLYELGCLPQANPEKDFWANTKAPEGTEYIVTNPPFSSKWLVLDALLENRINSAIILPWQCFYNYGLTRLEALRKRHGGTWSRHELGTNKFNRPDGTTKHIGCYILHWEF